MASFQSTKYQERVNCAYIDSAINLQPTQGFFQIKQNAVNLIAANQRISKAKLLVVEDIEINQKLAKLILEDLGYEIDIASNGQQAIALYKNNNYRAILMDIELPDMNGMAITKIIRNRELDNSIPIIALTALAKNDIEDECLAAGMNAVTTKPIIITELQQLLDEWCKKENNKMAALKSKNTFMSIPQQYISDILAIPGYTIARIAKESGIPRTTIMRLANGSVRETRHTTFSRLLAYYIKVNQNK